MKYIRLDQLARTTSGGTPSRGNRAYYGGAIPWLKSGELTDGNVSSAEESITQLGLESSSSKLLPAGTLLIAMYGATVGKLGILNFPAATNQAICAITPNDQLERDYLFYWLLSIRNQLIKTSFGGAQPNISQTVIQELMVPWVPAAKQISISTQLRKQLAEVETARIALKIQREELTKLANAIIANSISKRSVKSHLLGTVLEEIKQGIGENWSDFPTLGATRNGLAPAKEQPGKLAHKYKPAFPGTVFYNPMRILIGSIAFVDEEDTPGITSPDYVVLKGKPGKVDSRWFYYWLRSPLGVKCINSLARGAVRERMLFNRLAEGEIDLPDYTIQEEASLALSALNPLRERVEKNLQDIDLLPQKILAQAFEPQVNDHA